MRFRRIEARQTEQPPAQQGKSDRQRRRHRRAGRMLGLMLIAIIAALIAVVFWRQVWIITAGRVMAKEVRMTTVEPGRIAEVLVKQGESVRAGQPLVRMDVSSTEVQFDISRRKLEAELALSRAERDALERAGLDPAFSAAVEAAELELEQAMTERRLAPTASPTGTALAAPLADPLVERERRLLELRATTREDYEQAVARSSQAQRRAGVAGAPRSVSPLDEARLEARVRLAEQRREQARSRLEFARRRHGIEIDQRSLAVLRAEAEAELARQRLARGVIASPMDGAIGWVSRHPGDVVDKDDVVVTVIDPSVMWVEAYVPTGELADLQDGDTAAVRFSGLEGEYFGRLRLIYPEEQLEFRNVEVGQQLVRSPSRLSTVYHAVRIDLDGPPPPGVRPDHTARVRIRRR